MTETPPVLVITTDCVAVVPVFTLPKSRVFGVTDNWPGVTPVADTAMFTGETDPSLVKATFPETTPVPVGANETVIGRLALGARLNGVVTPVTLKPAGALIDVTFSVVPPVFVSVAGLFEVVPVATELNWIDAVALRVPGGATAAPVNPTTIDGFEASLVIVTVPDGVPATSGANWIVNTCVAFGASANDVPPPVRL